jgi:hypothetical protein
MNFERHAVAVPTWKCLMLAVLAVCTLVTSRVDAAPPSRPLTIDAARALPLGSRVTVEGSVTTPSGAFASSFFDVGFGLQDRSAGIYVSLQTNPGLSPGDQVRVTGVLADSYGLLILVPDGADGVIECGRGRHVAARRLGTSAIGEDTEGLLVSVKGTIVSGPSSDLPYGYKLSVDDGSGAVQIFVNVETDIDVSAFAVGQRVKVTGFSSQFDDHYEIDPRDPDDLVVVGRH